MQGVTQMELQKALRPTIELTKGTFGRITQWGWECSCGDGRVPDAKKDVALEDARDHFDTKHGSNHGRVGK